MFADPRGIQITKSPDYQITRSLYNFRRQRHDLQKLLLAQLASHGPEHARAYGFAGIIDQHCRILIEADISSIAPPMLLARAHDYRLHDLAFLYLAFGRGFFHGRG